MADPIVVIYSSESRAESARKHLLGLRKDLRFELSDAVVTVKTTRGKVKLNQLFNTAAVGAACGAIWGVLAGTIFDYGLIGAALGVAAGLLIGALMDYGLDDRFMKDLAGGLQPGGAALFLLTVRTRKDVVLAHLRSTDGIVVQVSPQKRDKTVLQDASAGVDIAPPIEMPAE
jgi:uncharacterized membrane protein